MRAAIDTNLLVYAEKAGPKQSHARSILHQLPSDRTVLPVQVCGEFYNVLTRKVGLGRSVAVGLVDQWRSIFELAATTAAAMSEALDLASDHHLSIWDAVVMASAAEAGCDLLLSEDLQDGFRWRGVTVVNPFAEPMSPLLDAFLAQP